MKKKILKIIGIVILVVIGLAISLPFLLEDKIANVVKSKVNQNLNATLDFEAADLSLIRSFPNAYINLKGVSLINKAPFEGDTLFAAGAIALDMSLMELFKSDDDPISIEKITLDDGKLYIKVNADQKTNYDIALNDKETPSETIEDEESSFILNLKEYAITNTTIAYDDFSSGMHLILSEVNHSGSGDLSLEASKLQTKTDALVSFEMDSTKYLNKNKIALDALIGIDLTESRYSFLDNKALVNQLPLVFDGFIKVNEDNQEVDISFKTPSSDFKNFLAVIPEAYASNLDGVTTTGNFEIEGMFKGIVDNDHIPTFRIMINSDNASFKYPDLSKMVRNVFIDAEIKNETGITEDTYVLIDRLSFQIDEDVFNLKSQIKDLLGNTKVNLDANGKINLANISRVYPMPEDYGLTGILTADVSTAFDMESLENHQYQNTKTKGTASLTRFHYESVALKHPVDIQEAALTFNPKTVTLDTFKGKTGETDFSATGMLTNLLGYIFNNENLEGRFNLHADKFSVDDFMVSETAELEEAETSNENTEKIKIPTFLDATIYASANSVQYDNLNLKNVRGRLLIKDQTARLENLQSDLFNGKLVMNGAVSTKEDTPTFNMDLDIDSFQISESFQALELFKVLAPVAQALKGKLNSDIKLSGNLKDDMTPNLASLSGNLLGQLFSAKVETENSPALTALANQFDFINLDAIDLESLKGVLSFSNGEVTTKPMKFNYNDIAINLSGSHSFNKKMHYEATLNVPTKYLGAKVNQLIARINVDSLKGMTLPVTANISGNYKNPKVTSDFTAGVSKMTKQLIEIQKQKLLDSGKDKAKDALANLLGKTSNTDANSNTSSDENVKETLGGLLENAKNDSVTSKPTTNNDGIKKVAKNVLGGLLGKKKKDATQQN